MNTWNTQKSVGIVQSVPECTVKDISDPEDYASEQIYVSVAGSGNSIWVRGFRSDGVQFDPQNPEIEMIEVTTGYSDGDMPNDPDYCVVHAKVKAAFMRAGYQVVNSMEGFF